MDAGQLKLLALKMRELLAQWDIEIPHGQALDLVAALPGLRNWPEVIAFPDRVAAREIDLDATGRLAHRIASRFAHRLPERWARRLDAADLMDELAPWRLLEPRDPSRRERLIVASGDSATGGLRGAAIADRVVPASLELVWGPVPAQEDPASFAAARLAAWDSDPATSDQPESWARDTAPAEAAHHRSWEHHVQWFAAYDRIELWMDPHPNAQLQLIQLLAWLGRDPELADKVFLMQADLPIGGCRPFEIRGWRARAAKVEAPAFELAMRAWNAWCQPTPRPWFELLASDIAALPRLRDTVRAMLAELPALRTGLRDTERRLLGRVAEDGATWLSVMPWMHTLDDHRVFGYWELGRLLDGLARGPGAAIAGLPDGPFDLALHEDAACWRRYNHSRLTLTPLGEALRRGEDDLARHRPLRFWWGGTRLTPERLWRWDEATQTLSA
jgi:hypothetical protein